MTEVVLWEWLNALSDPDTRGTAAEGYRRCHRDPRIEVVPPRADHLDAAVRLYEARQDKDWSLTDCLSFVVMEQRGLAWIPTELPGANRLGPDCTEISDNLLRSR